MRNNIFTGSAMTLIAVGLLVLVFCLGARLAQPTYAYQTPVDISADFDVNNTPAVECRVVATHTIEYIEKPVTEVKYVERVRNVPVALRNFSDLEELKQWLVNVKTTTTTIYFQSPGVAVDCDDFASTLQRKALSDGYIMSFQIIETGKYNSLFQNSKMPANTLHAINMAVIGNNAYYIEPQTGEIVFAAHLD